MAIPDTQTAPVRRPFPMTFVMVAIVIVLALVVLAASGVLANGITTIFWEALKAVVLLFWNLFRKF